MVYEDDHPVYSVEDLDEDDEEDLDDDIDDDPEEEDDDTSSSNLATGDPPSSTAEVTVAIAQSATPVRTAGVVTVATSLPDPNRSFAITAVAGEKKQIAAVDDSRRLFQRLWTDEDEIELLKGFLDYTSQRGGINSTQHHDTTAFYDQIKDKLQLEFNKNQLVEKLRRLKKKYRNVTGKINSGKEYVFKSPHDQVTFEISQKIWSGAISRSGGGGNEEGGLDDDEPNPNPNSFDHNLNGVDLNFPEKKGSRPRKRSKQVKVEETQQFNHQSPQIATPVTNSIPNLIQETVKSCLSPVFKELLHSATNSSHGIGGVGLLNPMPFSFGNPGPLNFMGGDTNHLMDEKWRKQQILELEVYSKRLMLVQDQIKSTLESLRSKGS